VFSPSGFVPFGSEDFATPWPARGVTGMDESARGVMMEMMNVQVGRGSHCAFIACAAVEWFPELFQLTDVRYLNIWYLFSKNVAFERIRVMMTPFYSEINA
jgi:hypothetical protein